MKKALLIIGSILSLVACDKEIEFNEVPEIKLLKFGPASVKEFQDSVEFVISYIDGDGDLGENNAEVKNLTLIDTRIGVHYYYRIQELVPNGDKVPIEGTLSFEIPTVYKTDSSEFETVFYEIYVVDRAGHKSNVLNVGPINILPQ